MSAAAPPDVHGHPPGRGAVERSPIVYGSSQPNWLERFFDLPADIAHYVSGDGKGSGERLMPWAAWLLGAWVLFGVTVQLWLRFGPK
jgi:hypothetical protein